MRPVGTASSLLSDGRSEIFAALLQPASEPAPREGETTYGGLKDGAEITPNSAIAYVSQVIRRRRDRSTQTLIAMDETRGRVLESRFHSKKVDSDELQDLRAIGTPTNVEQQQPMGEPRGVSPECTKRICTFWPTNGSNRNLGI